MRSGGDFEVFRGQFGRGGLEKMLMCGERKRRTVKVRVNATLLAFPSADVIEAIHNWCYSPNKELYQCGACEAVTMARAVTLLYGCVDGGDVVASVAQHV